jgi:hypothetical protein
VTNRGSRPVLAGLPLRRLGAWAGLLAFLLQLVVPLVHQPKHHLSIFPAAGIGRTELPTKPAPHHRHLPPQEVPCPICLSLQMAGTFVIPAAAALPAPAWTGSVAHPLVEALPPAEPASAHPWARGPPRNAS